MSRWLGIDHGTRRIGLAVGSEAAAPGPLAVIPARPANAAIAAILAAAKDYAVDGIVVGWPLNMDDTEGPQALLAREMAVELSRATDLDVRLWDERLSSFAADKALAGLLTRKQKRGHQDAVAAAEMLKEFFAGDGPRKAIKPQDTAG